MRKVRQAPAAGSGDRCWHRAPMFDETRWDADRGRSPASEETRRGRRKIPRSRNAPSVVGGRGQRLLLSRFCRLVLTLPCRRGCPLNCREELLGILGGQPAVNMQGGRGRRCHLDVALQTFDLPKLLANAPSGRFCTLPVEDPAFRRGPGHAPAPGAKQLCS